MMLPFQRDFGKDMRGLKHEDSYDCLQQTGVCADEKTGAVFEGEWPDCIIVCVVKCSSLGEISEKKSLAEITGEWFGKSDAILFVSSTGIAVRAVAPYLKHKSTDPAVIVVDGTGKFCISLLSGHAGGANELTNRIADFTGAVPVVTTATDLEGKFAVDDFARRNQMVVTDWKMAKRFSAGILEGKRVGIYSELPLEGELPEELFVFGKDFCRDNSGDRVRAMSVGEKMPWAWA